MPTKPTLKEITTDVTCQTCGKGKRVQLVDEEGIVKSEKCTECKFTHDLEEPL